MNDEFFDDIEPLKIPIHGVRLPEIELSPELRKKYNVPADADNYAFLRALCLTGFNKLKLKKDSKEYNEYVARIKEELEIVKELGFTDYFLLVWKVINFCTTNGIPTGLGRGSAVGSLVLYLIGVVRVDPIKHGLFFQRFISKIRAKKQVIDGITYLDGSLMPDVDMDICFYRRHEVLEYLSTEFKGKTSKILTFNTLSSKLLIKEVGKSLGMKSEEEMSDVTSMIPKLHGQVQDLDYTYENIHEFKVWCDANKKIYDTAMKLKDLIKNKGVHPSGIMISYFPLDKACPVEFAKTKEGVQHIVSSYNMDYVSLFSIKMDVLGLRGVSVVDDVCKHLKIKVEDINLDDPTIYRNLHDLKHPHGLFQIEADLAFRTTQKVKPRNLSELSAILALARPGAMQFIDQFALYTNHGTYEAIHEFYDDILKETGGVAIYQEQLMKMAHKIGFTLDEAELIRRIVGKKKVEEMAKWEKKVYDTCAANKLEEKIGKVLWDVMDASKDYSFNKSHTVAYAALCAITVYLKFKYPLEFYLSLLRMTKNEPDPITEISKIHKEMPYVGIELLPPSLIKSGMNFSIENGNIRFGLSSIKGIADKAIEKLGNFKRDHANKFKMFQSAKEAGLSIGIVSALIQAGALEDFEKKGNRSLLVYEAQLWNNLSVKEKQAALQIGEKYDFKVPATVLALCALKDDKGKPLIKESRFATIKKRTDKYKAIYEQNKKYQTFANWWYERNLLGYNCRSKLIEIFLPDMPSLVTMSKAMSYKEGAEVTIVGMVDENAKFGTSKKKSRYGRYSISDETGAAKVMIFNDALESCKEMHGGFYPKAKDIVIFKGKRMGDDAIFASVISVQQNKIYTKLSDLKDTSKEEELINTSPT